MLSLWLARLIRAYERSGDPASRLACGTAAGALGVALNILLFSLKLIAGVLSGSIAVIADAFNNLSDAGSSVITLIGFRLSGKRADPTHPFGHGRIEYVAGLIVSMIVIVMGAELLKSSVEAIFAPESVAFSALTAGILAFSVLVKGYMWGYNRLLAKKLDSSAMKAAAADSLSDAVATAVVLAAMLIARFAGLNIDGWAGLAVSLFIIASGIGAARDTVNPLLGMPPDPELVERIKSEALSTRYVMGLHDLVVHDYGPGRRMITLDVEVPADGDILLMHDEITALEQRLRRDLDCEAVIHMDPVVSGDRRTAALQCRVSELLAQAIDPRVRLHDFRVEDRDGHVELIFDAVVPYDVDRGDEALRSDIDAAISELGEGYHTTATIDRG